MAGGASQAKRRGLRLQHSTDISLLPQHFESILECSSQQLPPLRVLCLLMSPPHKCFCILACCGTADAIAVSALARLSLGQCVPQAVPLEQLLSKELEQQLEPLMSSHHLMPQAWISAFNQMLHQVWQQMK